MPEPTTGTAAAEERALSRRPQVVLLMAGAGSRFRRAGYTESKPLIDVRGVPMFERALRGVTPLAPERIVAVVRQEQIDDERIVDDLHRANPAVQVAVLPSMTRGAAESALAAEELLDPDAPVVVLDCDLEFSSPAYVALAGGDGPVAMDALLLTFTADHARYSFAAVDPETGRVHEVAEKRVISDRAIAGAYWFAVASRFFAAARRLAETGPSSGVTELYMSEVVRAVLGDGGLVLAAPVEQYASFGTPEELAEYLAAS